MKEEDVACASSFPCVLLAKTAAIVCKDGVICTFPCNALYLAAITINTSTSRFNKA